MSDMVWVSKGGNPDGRIMTLDEANKQGYYWAEPIKKAEWGGDFYAAHPWIKDSKMTAEQEYNSLLLTQAEAEKKQDMGDGLVHLSLDLTKGVDPRLMLDSFYSTGYFDMNSVCRALAELVEARKQIQVLELGSV